ncbi:MAG: hypothetical protein RL490_1886 [Pseudomonadota bacterium]|jgi:uracil-DNA glycosylase family 4
MEIDSPELSPPPSPIALARAAHVPSAAEPPLDCPLCPRLAAYRDDNAARQPGWWNAPVPGFGDPEAWLAIAGLAPGVQGANRTGRPFTGDWAGLLLFQTLEKFGLSSGVYAGKLDDGLSLHGAFITNAVRCVPPQNKPEPAEIKTCRGFHATRLAALPNLQIIITLGSIAHQSTIKALGGKLPKYPFGHNAVHRLPGGMIIIDSYHCSRLNTNTGRLTPDMFEAVFATALSLKA